MAAPQRDDAEDTLAELRRHVLGKKPDRPPALKRFGIWPENWPAVQLFVALSTQWRRAGMTGARSGLDYAAIPPTAALVGIETDAELMQRLQVMEGEVLRIDGERRKREQRR